MATPGSIYTGKYNKENKNRMNNFRQNKKEEGFKFEARKYNFEKYPKNCLSKTVSPSGIRFTGFIT